METFEILSAPTESSATLKFAEAASLAGNRVSQRSVSQPSTRKRFRDRDRLATRRRIVLLERNASSSRASAATGDFHLFFSSPPSSAPPPTKLLIRGALSAGMLLRSFLFFPFRPISRRRSDEKFRSSDPAAAKNRCRRRTRREISTIFAGGTAETSLEARLRNKSHRTNRRR